MSKNKFKIGRTPRQQPNGIEHIIQTRITTTRDKHVCHLCGNDAYLLDTSYEVLDVEMLNQLSQRLKGLSVDEAWEASKHSDAAETIYASTVKEQRTVGPQEHYKQYTCYRCMAYMLSKGTGIEYSGDVVLMRLMRAPASHAVFVIRRLDDPERMLLMNALYQDVTTLLADLQHEEEIPRSEITHIWPNNKQSK